jgi:hypothetical protein
VDHVLIWGDPITEVESDVPSRTDPECEASGVLLVLLAEDPLQSLERPGTHPGLEGQSTGASDERLGDVDVGSRMDGLLLRRQRRGFMEDLIRRRIVHPGAEPTDPDPVWSVGAEVEADGLSRGDAVGVGVAVDSGEGLRLVGRDGVGLFGGGSAAMGQAGRGKASTNGGPDESASCDAGHEEDSR